LKIANCKLQIEVEPRRILIVKPSAIGDVVHALPILNLIRRKWPTAHIAWLVTPACAGLLDGHPQLNEVIRFERRKFGKGWRDPGAAAGLWRFSRGLRERKFDLVIDLQGLLRSALISWKTGAPVRIGLANAREGAPLFYTHRVPIATMEQHAIERYLAVAEALGCGHEPVEFIFPPRDDADRAHIDGLISPGRKFAVLMPGANWETKRWPVEKFAAMVPQLRERFGLESIVSGGPEVAELAAQIPGTLDLSGKTTLRQMVQLLERADLIIANDTGPMHIAAALGRPLVTPYGPTNPIRTGPYRRESSMIRIDIPCSPCYSRRCSHQSCLQWLKIEPVLELAAEQMNGSQS